MSPNLQQENDDLGYYRLYVHGACIAGNTHIFIGLCLSMYIHQQCGHHWSHKSEIKFIMNKQAGLHSQFNVVTETEKPLQATVVFSSHMHAAAGVFMSIFMQPQVSSCLSSCSHRCHTQTFGTVQHLVGWVCQWLIRRKT